MAVESQTDKTEAQEDAVSQGQDEVALPPSSDQAKSKKGKPRHSLGNVYITCKFSNTIITIATRSGDTLLQKSAGQMGYKGARKGTPFAAQQAAEAAAKEVIDRFGMKKVSVYVCGPGAGREQALRSLHNAGLTVEFIEDTTKIPHNGCKSRKKRRV